MVLQHDGTLDIAIGRSREEKRWLNKEMMWSSLLERVSTTHRTAETYDEYMKYRKSKQDTVKDIGGFVGGIIQGGRRLKNSVIQRQLLTLDIDFADAALSFWEKVKALGFAAGIYTTHKHSRESPRLRILLPLDKPVDPDQYEAIARKVASWLDIEVFDPTTFQPSRLMYWPSSSKDAEYVFEYVDNKWLRADDVLAKYKDWQDSTQWPVSSKAKVKVISDIKKQGDPLAKRGLVGAFCRTYSISEAISVYLADTYLPSEVEDRFTYVNGSTANGLVIYEDKWAFSHHATDPISEKLCNAWDLIRLHKFGHLDEKIEESLMGIKMPSFVAMTELASADQLVRVTIGEEKLQEARELFGDLPELDAVLSEPEEDLVGELEDVKKWMGKMKVDKAGNYLSTIDNIVLVLENDPGLKGCFAWDSFENKPVITRDLPWRRLILKDVGMVDADLAALRHYLELIYGLTSTQKIDDGLLVVMHRHKFHPVNDYLDALQWDGVKRAERLFIDYLGVDNNVYTRTVTRKFLLAAVTRVHEPGCKFDEVLVVIGEQGIGKSTIFNKLAGKWFSDSLSDLRGKDALEQIQGVWIVEMAELESLKKAEIETFKHFVSKLIDRYRAAFGKLVQSYPRQCVFVGTTNEENFLKDLTGNRRFWPLNTDMKRAYNSVFKLTQSIVNQIWAEVMTWYLEGEELHLSDDLKEEQRKITDEHLYVDDRVGALKNYLEIPLPVSWDDMLIPARRVWLAMQGDDEQMAEKGVEPRPFVCGAEIWCELLTGNIRELNGFNSREVHNLMKRVKGWKKTTKMKQFKLYGRQVIYERI